MINVTGLGGCREVGRMAISVNTDREKFLFDYGIDVQGLRVPLKPELPLNGVFLTHAHLDHCGMLPELYKRGYSKNLYATPLTFDLTHLLLQDSLKVQSRRKQSLFFLPQDIEKMESKEKPVNYGQEIRFQEAAVSLYQSGHVPGSATILLEDKGKRILYTGDINFINTELMRAAYTKYRDVDLVMCEATYYYKNHPDREELAHKLREAVQSTVENNGIVLLPSFAVGRTQELLLILHDLGFPIYLDGMGIDATKIILQHPNSVNNYKKLRKAFDDAHKVRRDRDRKEIIKKPGIVITTAGMLNGGPIGYYMRRLHKREDCALIMTGFQVHGTVGKTLVDTGRYIHEGIDVKPDMHIEFMDFSAHCGKDDLVEFIEKLNPKKVFPVHSDGAEQFASELKTRGIDSYAPKIGERLTV